MSAKQGTVSSEPINAQQRVHARTRTFCQSSSDSVGIYVGSHGGDLGCSVVAY
jgi:hypothetical protein